MHKGSDLIGKAVVSYDTGQHEGYIKRLLLDPAHARFLGFLVETKEGGPTEVLPLNRVRAIGADAIVVTQASVPVEQEVSLENSVTPDEDLLAKQRKIFTSENRDLGTLVDVYVDRKNGNIIGYATKQGAFADVSGGQTFVPAMPGIKVGKDILFVPAHTTEQMTEREPPAEAGAETFVKAGAQERREAQTIHEVEGRRARRTVYTDQKEIIVAQGQIITSAMIEQAHNHNQGQRLVESTYASPWAPYKFFDDDLWQTARLRFQEEAQQLKGEIGKVWHRVKESAGELGKFRSKPSQTSENVAAPTNPKPERQTSYEPPSSDSRVHGEERKE